MTQEQKEILTRINAYAEQVLQDIDPQKTQISLQLDKLKPVMKEIADEKGMALEDVFILYMDLASEAAVNSDKRMREELADLQDGDGTPFLFR